MSELRNYIEFKFSNKALTDSMRGYAEGDISGISADGTFDIKLAVKENIEAPKIFEDILGLLCCGLSEDDTTEAAALYKAHEAEILRKIVSRFPKIVEAFGSEAKISVNIVTPDPDMPEHETATLTTYSMVRSKN